MIELTHNFDPRRFVWLWAKYVTDFNERHHCTNSIRGRYSKKLSKRNAAFTDTNTLVLDEQPEGTYRAIYICGVAREGYAQHRNYSHNVHAAVVADDGTRDTWAFENWQMTATNGRFIPIPATVEELPLRYRSLPSEYTGCRIFRWAACYFTEGVNGQTRGRGNDDRPTGAASS